MPRSGKLRIRAHAADPVRRGPTDSYEKCRRVL